ncbi:hypothetical protein QAD02_013444, partial [Eretmocerus hayati]
MDGKKRLFPINQVNAKCKVKSHIPEIILILDASNPSEIQSGLAAAPNFSTETFTDQDSMGGSELEIPTPNRVGKPARSQVPPDVKKIGSNVPNNPKMEVITLPNREIHE